MLYTITGNALKSIDNRFTKQDIMAKRPAKHRRKLRKERGKLPPRYYARGQRHVILLPRIFSIKLWYRFESKDVKKNSFFY